MAQAKKKAASEFVTSVIDSMVIDADESRVIHLWADGEKVILQAFEPFGETDSEYGIAVLIGINGNTRLVTIHDMDDTVQIVLDAIRAEISTYKAVGDLRITFRPERGKRTWEEYRNKVKAFAVDCDKTEEEIDEMTEHMFATMNEYNFRDLELDKWFDECEDDCLIWDELNDFPTSSSGDYAESIYDKYHSRANNV